jgi:hypothetical protein
VFISFGGLFFLAFLAAAVFYCIKRRKKKMVEETDIIHVDEQRKVKEAIIEGAHGPQAVILSIVLKCPTLLRDPCLVDFISHGHPSSLKASFESE